MDLESFVQNVAGQFDLTPAEQITPETNFHELSDWSSLVALSIIAMCDDEYGVALKGDDIKNAKSVRELFDTVVGKANRGVL